MKKHLTILIAIIATNTLLAQQSYTLYNMDRVLQSQFVNTSIDLNYKYHVGGILVPVFGQVPPPIAFNYANNSFHYNHILHHGEGILKDSLVFDETLLMSKLRKTTHLRFNTDIELINLGFKLENFFLTIALTEKMRYGISLPYDLFEFALNGNRPYMLKDKAHDFSGLGINFSHYRELAVGGIVKANDKINIGARIKILFGLGHFNTAINKLSIKTDPEDYSMKITTDMKIYSSLPVKFDYAASSFDSVKININEESIEEFKANGAMGYLLNFRNIGLGFDLGASYKYSSKIDIYGSVTDLGFISWSNNSQIFSSKGTYDFEGIHFDLWKDSTDRKNAIRKMTDTIFNTFNFKPIETLYISSLQGNIYLGVKYKFHNMLHFTALYRGEFYRKSYIQSLTIGANSNITDWLSAHLTWTYGNNTIANLGLGLSARLGFVNWYLVSDNVVGMIWPQKTKNINFRVGCNLVFGREKKIRSNSLY